MNSNILQNSLEIINSLEKNVISRSTCDTMKELLEGVVSEGGGSNCAIEGYAIGGKTATSQKLPRGNGKYIASFIGFAPADNPQIAVLVLLDMPTVGNISGGINTAPIVRRFMEEALPYLDIDAIYTEDEQNAKSVIMPDLTGMSYSDAEAALKKLGLTCSSVGSEAKITDQVPAANATVSSNTKAILIK